ncbi:hypothetical protein PG994_014991 [Apiospora phragmitis]|uniref:Uncharacterized protein n=1 Tax=Apiospora phragmitis TaxID=2905665 RepID=A0ABR1SWW0_9PEZI
MEMILLRSDQAAPNFHPIVSEAGMTNKKALNWVGVGASAAFIGTRTYIQCRRTRGKLYTNDYLIFLALLCHLAAAIVCQVAIPSMYELERFIAILRDNQARGESGSNTTGAQQHISIATSPTPLNVTASSTEQRFVANTELYFRYQFALSLLLWTTLWAVKFSLLFFFWRLFDSVTSLRPARLCWYVMTGITASTLVVTVSLFLFACGNPANNFTYVMLIPFPLLRHLKYTLAGIFLLPIIPIMFGVLRLVFCNPTVGSVNTIKFQMFSMLENTAAMITSCLPSLRLFVAQQKNQSRSSGNNSNSKRTSSVAAAVATRRPQRTSYYHLDDGGAACIRRGSLSSTNKVGSSSETAATAACAAEDIPLESIVMSSIYHQQQHQQQRGEDGEEQIEQQPSTPLSYPNNQAARYRKNNS